MELSDQPAFGDQPAEEVFGTDATYYGADEIALGADMLAGAGDQYPDDEEPDSLSAETAAEIDNTPAEPTPSEISAQVEQAAGNGTLSLQPGETDVDVEAIAAAFASALPHPMQDDERRSAARYIKEGMNFALANRRERDQQEAENVDPRTGHPLVAAYLAATKAVVERGELGGWDDNYAALADKSFTTMMDLSEYARDNPDSEVAAWLRDNPMPMRQS